jgi:hypothetical protein
VSRLHLALTLLWASLIVPTVLWWGESVLWVSIISVYANFVGHWSSFQAARAEEKAAEAQVAATKKER